MEYLIGEDAHMASWDFMVSKVINQIHNKVEWGELDIVVLDLLPGTGDIHISLTQ